MSKKKSSKPKAETLLIEGAKEVLAQYSKNHRELRYPGMAKIAEALKLIEQSGIIGKTLDKEVDEVVTNTVSVPLDPPQIDA